MSDNTFAITPPKYPKLAMLKARMRHQLVQIRRKFPYLVWYGQEVDVGVTFMQDKLPSNSSMEDAFRTLYSGKIYDVEKQIKSMGIGFDTGVGFDGRDWEWDWSLSGPISVRFRSRAKCPERRRERPKPTLAYSAENQPA